MELITTGKATPSFIVSHKLPLGDAPEAYKHFDERDNGWTKVILKPGMTARTRELAGAGATSRNGSERS